MPSAGDVWTLGSPARGAPGCEPQRGYQIQDDVELAAAFPEVGVSFWFRFGEGEGDDGAGAPTGTTHTKVPQCMVRMHNADGVSAEMTTGRGVHTGDHSNYLSVLIRDSSGNVAEAATYAAIRDGRWHFVRWRLSSESRAFKLEIDDSPMILKHTTIPSIISYTKHRADGLPPPPMTVDFGFHSAASMKPISGVISEIRLVQLPTPQHPSIRVLRQYYLEGEAPFRDLAPPLSPAVPSGMGPALHAVGEGHELLSMDLPVARLFMDGYSSAICMGSRFCDVGKSIGLCTWKFHLSSATPKQQTLCDIKGLGAQRFIIILNSNSHGNFNLDRIWVRLTDIDGMSFDAVGVHNISTGKWHHLVVSINIENKQSPISLQVDDNKLLFDTAVEGSQDTLRSFGAFETMLLGCALEGCPVAQSFRGFIQSLDIEAERDFRICFDESRGNTSCDLVSGMPIALICPLWRRNKEVSAVLNLDRGGHVLFSDTNFGEQAAENFSLQLWLSTTNKAHQTLCSAFTAKNFEVKADDGTLQNPYAGITCFSIDLNYVDGGAEVSKSTLKITDLDGRILEVVFNTTGLCDGKWHYFCLSVICSKKGIVEVQIDGANVATTKRICEQPHNFGKWSKLLVGATYSQGELRSFFSGDICELRLLQNQRLFAYWPMNQGAGLAIMDEVGQAHGKPIMCTWKPPTAPFRRTHLYLNSNACVVLEPPKQLWESLSKNRGASIEACILAVSSESQSTLFSLADSRSGQSLTVALNTDALCCPSEATLSFRLKDAYGNGLLAHAKNLHIFDGTFHHITWRVPYGVATGLAVQLIIDGVMIPTADLFVRGAVLKGLRATDHPLILGALCRPSVIAGVTDCYEGFLSFVRVWGGEDAELLLDMPLNDGLTSAGIVSDLSQNRNLGHLRGTVWMPLNATEGPTTIPSFQGVDSCMNLGTLGETGQFLECLTIDMWLQITQEDEKRVAPDASGRCCNRTTQPDLLPAKTSGIIGGFDGRGLGFAICFDLETEKAILVLRDLDNKRLVVEAGGELRDSVWHRLTVEILSAQRGEVKLYVDGHSKPVTVLEAEHPSRFAEFESDIYLGGVSTPVGLIRPFSGFIQNLRILTHTYSVQGHWPLRNNALDTSGNENHARNVNTKYKLVDWDGTEPSSIVYFGSEHLATMKQREVSRSAVCECSSWDPKDPGFRPVYVLRPLNDPGVGWKASGPAPQWVELDFGRTPEGEVSFSLTGVNLVFSSDSPGILHFEVHAGDNETMVLLCRRKVFIENKAAVHCRCAPIMENVTRVRVIVAESPSVPACHRVKCLGYSDDAETAVEGCKVEHKVVERLRSRQRVADLLSEVHIRTLFNSLGRSDVDDTVSAESAKTALEGLNVVQDVTAVPSAVVSEKGRVSYDAFCQAVLKLLSW